MTDASENAGLSTAAGFDAERARSSGSRLRSSGSRLRVSFLSRFRSLFDDFFNRFFSFLNAFFSFRSRFASLPSELDDEESLSLLDRVRRLPMDGRASLCTRQRAGVPCRLKRLEPAPLLQQAPPAFPALALDRALERSPSGA